MQANKVERSDLPEIYQFPMGLERTKGSLTVGDLHANAAKLFHLLFRHEVVEFDPEKITVSKEDSYHQFVTLYEKMGILAEHQAYLFEYEAAKKRLELIVLNEDLNEDLNEKMIDIERLKTKQEELKDIISNESIKLNEIINEFNGLLQTLQLSSAHDIKTRIRLIGDELADRGSNDYFTLMLMNFLKEKNVPITTLISNHGAEFLNNINALINGHSIKPSINPLQIPSLFGLQLCLKEQRIQRDELKELVDTVYKPTLKVLDYSLSADKTEMTLYTHAPVSFEMIRLAANKLGVLYNDSTAEALAITIDKINAQFQDHIKKGTGTKFINVNINAADMDPQERIAYPLMNFIWNRWDEYNRALDNNSIRPNRVNGYEVKYVHGHDEPLSKLPHVKNLDNDCGKYSLAEEYADNQSTAPMRDRQRYGVHNTTEKGLEYQIHDPAMIEKEYQEFLKKQVDVNTTIRRGKFWGLIVSVILGFALTMTGVLPLVTAGTVGVLLTMAIGAAIGASLTYVIGGFMTKYTIQPPHVETLITPTSNALLHGALNVKTLPLSNENANDLVDDPNARRNDSKHVPTNRPVSQGETSSDPKTRIFDKK